MLASEMVEIICAAHLSSYVESPFQERSGIMLVGPPAALKSTFASVLDKQYADVVMYSDVNVKTLTQIRDQMANGTIRTLVLPELAKLYERNPATATNIEGTIRALVAEGFSAAAFEDARVNRLKARAVVIGAMTSDTQGENNDRWEKSGFNRRFLWPLIRLEDSRALLNAIVEWNLIDFQLTHVPRAPIGLEKIPNLTTRPERNSIEKLVKYQPGGDHAIQMHMLVKMLAVLRWWYTETGDSRNPMKTLQSFAESLGREGAEIKLERPKRANVKLEEQMVMETAAKQLARRRWSGKRKKKLQKKKVVRK